jgi:hypothetical protein
VAKDTSQTTWEEASRCYKCQQPGVEVANLPAAERWQGRVHTIECQNHICLNFGQRWIVQVRPDGSIPNRDTSTRGEKSFPKMTAGQESFARRGIEDAIGKRLDEA